MKSNKCKACHCVTPVVLGAVCTQQHIRSRCQWCLQRPFTSVTRCWKHWRFPSVWEGLSRCLSSTGGRWVWARRGRSWSHLYVSRTTALLLPRPPDWSRRETFTIRYTSLPLFKTFPKHHQDNGARLKPEVSQHPNCCIETTWQETANTILGFTKPVILEDWV